MTKHICLLSFIISHVGINAQETQPYRWIHNRPDSHAPIGVMGDHVHHKNDWMFSYRYMNMTMEGTRKDENNITKEEVLRKYQMSPQHMTMIMHMLGVMYAPSDKITLMAMVNHSIKLMSSIWMQHDTNQTPMLFEYDKYGRRKNAPGDTMNAGLSDMSIGVLIHVLKLDHHALHLNTKILIPLGSITQKGTSMSEDKRSPYSMQTGTGSFGTRLGLTYLTQGSIFSGGFQPLFTYFLNSNSQGYRYGNTAEASLWGAAKFNHWISASIRLNYKITGSIVGRDNVLNTQKNMVSHRDGRQMTPTLEETFSGCEILQTGVGLNLIIPSGALKGFRVEAEYLIPTYQNVRGVQMNGKRTLVVGLQYTL